MTVQELATPSRIYRLRVEDYLLLDNAGTFAAYAKTELLDGEIFYMNAQHRPHARIKSRLYEALREALRAIASPGEPLIEASIAMPDHSVPEPDIVVTDDPEGDGLVPLSSVRLVVEVADTSLAQDLGLKAALYAREGIPEYWVVDVNGRVIHQLWAPVGDTFGGRREHAFGARIEAETIVGLSVATQAL